MSLAWQHCVVLTLVASGGGYLVWRGWRWLTRPAAARGCASGCSGCPTADDAGHEPFVPLAALRAPADPPGVSRPGGKH